MPNNDLISSFLDYYEPHEAHKLVKVYRTQIKENPSLANSDLYIKIGDCYTKSLMFEYALKYYNKARYLELNNPEKQELILEKISNLHIAPHYSYFGDKLEVKREEVEECTINFNNKLQLSSNVFAEKFNSFEESIKLSQGSAFIDYLEAAKCSLELGYYEHAIKYYGYATSVANGYSKYTDPIITEIQTKMALIQREYAIKFILTLEGKQMEVAQHLYKENDVAPTGEGYNLDENIV
ncbi:MAG: hypothetical protein RLZZ81_1303 [Pseudomonadota bacterium]|jgi:tetratricopeptide (TPR) repeat protein